MRKLITRPKLGKLTHGNLETRKHKEWITEQLAKNRETRTINTQRGDEGRHGEHSRNKLGETRQEEAKLNTLKYGCRTAKVKQETRRHRVIHAA